MAICDLVPELVDRFDSQWGDRWPDFGRYTDYGEMLTKERLDLISVATPDHVHAEVVFAAIPSGVKGIYCEKPMATTLADADRMIAKAEDHGVAMVINLTRRWYATYQRVKEIIDSGQLGRIQITEPGGIEVMTMARDGIGGRPRMPVETPLYRWTDGTAAIDELIGLIEGRITESQSSPREGRKSLGILFAMLQSQHQGNVPIVAPFADAPSAS